MYVRKSDVAAYGHTPGCKGCRDVIREKPHCALHSRECRERMERMLSETDAGKRRVKASEDRWVNAAVRRSDIIFAEAEEKKRRTEAEGAEVRPAVEATLTGGSSGSGGPTIAPPIAPASRKRRSDVDIEEIDPAAGESASSPSVIVETTGTKWQADTSVADIDPQSGDGTDVAALVFAPPLGGGWRFAHRRESRLPVGGVLGCSPPRWSLALCSPPG